MKSTTSTTPPFVEEFELTRRFGRGSLEEQAVTLRRLRVVKAKKEMAFALAQLGRGGQLLNDEFFSILEALTGIRRESFNAAVNEYVNEEKAQIIMQRFGPALLPGRKRGRNSATMSSTRAVLAGT